MPTIEGQSLVPTPAEEDRFWALIEAAWAGRGPEVNRARQEMSARVPTAEDYPVIVDRAIDAMLAELTGGCREFGSEQLTDLDRVLERAMYLLDREDVHEVTDGSNDGFLYVRGFIVAMGRDFYRAVLADPRYAVLTGDCQEVPYFFARLHEERFGGSPVTGSGLSRESVTNPAGWPHLA